MTTTQYTQPIYVRILSTENGCSMQIFCKHQMLYETIKQSKFNVILVIDFENYAIKQ